MREVNTFSYEGVITMKRSGKDYVAIAIEIAALGIFLYVATRLPDDFWRFMEKKGES